MTMYVPVTSRANTVTVRPVELVCFSLLVNSLNDNLCGFLHNPLISYDLNEQRYVSYYKLQEWLCCFPKVCVVHVACACHLPFGVY